MKFVIEDKKLTWHVPEEIAKLYDFQEEGHPGMSYCNLTFLNLCFITMYICHTKFKSILTSIYNKI